jgi:hypothetical protein
MFSKLVFLLLLSVLTLADINKDYASIIHGHEELSDVTIEEMYDKFL